MLFSAESAGSTGGAGTGRRWGRTALGAVAAVATLLVGAGAGAGAGGTSHQPVQAQSVRSTISGQVAFDKAVFDRTFRDGMVRVDGATLHYVKGGHGPALVLLHGWPETSWEWHKVAPALAKTHTVIAIDLPGLGKSSIPSSGFDAATTARRLHQAVVALG